ncbi:bacteriohemerythrin [Sulfitobacter sp. JB4-11]|uniref:bacteriohemerythrin n=1 Tax=Sulfitobacter rhodophyticola TaxID=3238304 RepID=UPI003D815591
MVLLEWKPEFSVGDPAVDHEHKELIDLVNRAAGSILENLSEEEIDKSFGDLLHGISAHFAHEERQMRTSTYDQLDAHKADHERLLDALRDIMDEERHAPEQSAERLVEILSDWFIGHFSTHDARLHNKLGPHHHD